MSDQPLSPITGRPRPTAQQVAAAAEHQQALAQALHDAIAADCVTADDLTARLGTSHDWPRIALLTIDLDDSSQFPLWQFDATSHDGLLNGLADVLAALPARSPFLTAAWLTSPKKQLQSRTPIQAIKAGELANVLGEAQASRA